MADWRGVFDEEEELTEPDANRYGTRSGTIFLIDYGDKMQTGGRLRMAVSAAKNVLRSKCFQQPRDVQAVVFYDTEASINDHQFRHCSVLVELAQPDIQRILLLDAYSAPNPKKHFLEDFGSVAERSGLFDALNLCQVLFEQCEQSMKLSEKQIILLTCNDNPLSGPDDGPLRLRLQKFISDIQDKGCRLTVASVPSVDDEKTPAKFDFGQFYGMVVRDVDGVNVANNFSELCEVLRYKENKNRALARFNLTFTDDVAISVSLHKLVHPSKKPSSVKVEKTTLTPTRAETEFLVFDHRDQPQMSISKDDVGYYMDCGGRQLRYTADELLALRTYEVGMKLISFVPIDQISADYYVADPMFLYPDDNKIENSCRLFWTLYWCCVQRRVAAVCWLVARARSPPRLVCLVPQQLAEEDWLRRTVTPPGFTVVSLPWLDDCREFAMLATAGIATDQEAKDLLFKGVNGMRLADFCPINFDDPHIELFNRVYEAKALSGLSDLDQQPPFRDTSAPSRDEIINEKSVQSLREFSQRFRLNLLTDSTTTSGRGRRAGRGRARAK